MKMFPPCASICHRLCTSPISAQPSSAQIFLCRSIKRFIFKSSLFPPMACISNPCNEEPSTSAMFVDPMILVSKLLGMSEAEFRQIPFIVSMRTVLVGIGVLSTGLTSKIKRFITELTKADRRRCLGDTEQPAEKAQRYVIMIRIPPLIVFQRRFCTKILKG